MRIFVYEYLCATASVDLPASLASEGRAMLAAVVEDFARLPEVEVHTVWARSLGSPPFGRSVQVREVSTGQGCERDVFDQTARDCDAAFVIAPECGGLLAERYQWVAESGCRWLGCGLSAIERCTDKLALSQHLAELGVSVIPTESWYCNGADPDEFQFPIVIKPRDGAGSQATYLVGSADEYRRTLPSLLAEPLLRAGGIWQPFIPGDAVSVAVLTSADGSEPIVMPVCRQHLSDDGRFHYLGGSVPADITNAEVVQSTALDACRQVPELAGYVGVDLIIPEINPQRPVVVEINPRLTTSYLGYRQLTSDNLAKFILDPSSTSPVWHCHRTASFNPC